MWPPGDFSAARTASRAEMGGKAAAPPYSIQLLLLNALHIGVCWRHQQGISAMHHTTSWRVQEAHRQIHGAGVCARQGRNLQLRRQPMSSRPTFPGTEGLQERASGFSSLRLWGQASGFSDPTSLAPHPHPPVVGFWQQALAFSPPQLQPLGSSSGLQPQDSGTPA